MLNIVRQIKCNFQSEEEINEIIEFEKENNYGYDIVCDNLIDARKLAMLLDKWQFATFHSRRLNGEYKLIISLHEYAKK